MAISKKIIDAYEKHAPKNITLEQFADMAEKDPWLMSEIENDTLGDFSTFDSYLAKRNKELDPESDSSSHRFRRLLSDSVDDDVVDKIMQERAKLYEEVVCSDDEILTSAWMFDTLSDNEKRNLALKIIRASNKLLNLKQANGIPQVSYGIKIKQDSSSIRKLEGFIDKIIKKIFPKKGFGLQGRYNDNAARVSIVPQDNFAFFINVLSHEYSHFIDYRYPELGMLGAQIAKYGNSVYISSEEDYEKYLENPTELSAFATGNYVEQHIEKVLKEQAEKRPELYIKALQKAIDKQKAKVAAANLKRNLQKYVNSDWRLLRKYEKLLSSFISKHRTCNNLGNSL
jgi:hypothetical protein